MDGVALSLREQMLHSGSVPLWTIVTGVTGFKDRSGKMVQIPLWTIVTINFLSRPACRESVQIPLWTIVTRDHRHPLYSVAGSDSSMDGVTLPYQPIIEMRLAGSDSSGRCNRGRPASAATPTGSDSSMDDLTLTLHPRLRPGLRSDSSMDDCNPFATICRIQLEVLDSLWTV